MWDYCCGGRITYVSCTYQQYLTEKTHRKGSVRQMTYK